MPQRQTLQQNLSQRLSQRQLALMRLVEANQEELEELISKEIAENPALEEGPEEDLDLNTNPENPENDDDDEPTEISYEDALERGETTRENDNFDSNSDDWESNDYSYFQSSEDDRYEKPIIATTSFREDLVRQIGELDISEEEELIAKYIVGWLNDDGYLDSECRSIANRLLITENLQISANEVELVLKQVIQNLEPPGIGARNLQECLLLQIRYEIQKEAAPELTLAERILQKDFELFYKKKYNVILRKEKISQAELDKILGIITKLNPKPGGGAEENNYVIPDFIISIENNEPTVTLANPYDGRLRVNREYEKLFAKMTEKRNAEARKFIRENIDKAKAFIELMPERDRTMYLVMNEIVQQQKPYFLSGDLKELRPMVLADIEKKTNLDVSTVSRITSRRYALTPYGTILLKKLFSESVGSNDKQEGASSVAVREVLKELIDAENTNCPFTDEKLTTLLKEKGYDISRRTVVKYREQLGIDNSNMRKKSKKKSL